LNAAPGPALGYRAAVVAAPAAPRRVLVVRFGRVGDLLVLTPALRAMRRAWPEAEIDLLTTATGRATLGAYPVLRAVHVADIRRLPPHAFPQGRLLLASLRERRYDLGIGFERNPRHHRWLLALDLPRVVLFVDEGREMPPHVEGIPLDLGRHYVDCATDLCAVVGVAVTDPRPDFPVAPRDEAEADALLARHGVDPLAPLVAVHPGAYHRRARILRSLRVRKHPKLWPPERYAALMRALAERGAGPFLLTGSRAERRWDERVRRLACGLPVVDLAGETGLGTLAALLRRCRLLVAPDTGTAHLAAAVGTPVVALHSAWPPSAMGARGLPGRVEQLWPEPSRDGLLARRGYHPRLWAISVDEVCAAVDRLGVRFGSATEKRRTDG